MIANKILEQFEPSEKEPDKSNKFSSYYAGKCKRQILRSKLGEKGSDIKGSVYMKFGSIIHEWLEDIDIEAEKEIKKRIEHNGIRVSAKADLLTEDYVADYKTTRNFRGLKNKIERHRPQINIYMKAFDRDKAKLVYLNKYHLFKPDSNFKKKFIKVVDLNYRPELFEETINKYQEVYEAIQNNVTFEKCGCYSCRNE